MVGRTLTTLAAVLVATLVAQAEITYGRMDFVGTWQNVDAATGGCRRFEISVDVVDTLIFRGFGACGPGECEWDPVPLVLYSDSVADQQARYATWRHDVGFALKTATLDLDDGEITMSYYTQFTDGSGRSSFRSVEVFRRASAGATAAEQTAPLFADANLERAIRDALGRSAGEPLAADDLLALERLDARGYEIASLAGIEGCRNLKRLVLWENRIRDISPLAQLTALEYLDLDDNSIVDLTPLQSMAKLTWLYASYNGIQSIAPLAALASLEGLFIHGNLVTDVSPLASLSRLVSLGLSGNPIRSLPPLASMGRLQELYASDCGIQDISPLASLRLPQAVDLSGNAIRDISALSHLAESGLCTLSLARNAIVDLQPLAGYVLGTCRSSSTLDLSFNEIVDLTPLVDLSGPSGSALDVRGNPIDLAGAPAAESIIARLRADGIRVLDAVPLDVGEEAPSFALRVLGGDTMISLDDLSGQVVVLDFWASWCGPCRASMPGLEERARSVDGVVLIGVNLDREESAAAQFLADSPLSKMVVVRGTFAEAAAVSLAYGDMLSNGIPQTFVIDRDGIIRYSGHPNGLTEEILRSIVGAGVAR